MRRCHWEWTTLGDIAKISSGGTPSRTNPAYWGEKIPWVTTSLIDFNLIHSVEEYITEEGLKNSAAKIFPAGTLLMALYGQGVTRGKVAMLGLDAATNQACASIIPHPRIKPLFLFYYLQGQYDVIRNMGHGGNQQNLSGQLIKEIPVPLPNIVEQELILSIIQKWDRSIDFTEGLITAKHDRRTWLVQQLLTGKRRLPGFEKSKELRKTSFGTLPVDWSYPRIGETASEASERNGNSEGRPVLSCTKHQGLVDSLAYFGKRIFSEDLSTYKLVRRGQFAYATNHIEEGSIGYQNTYDEALISPIYTVFQTDDTIDDRFLFLILKTETYRHIFASNTSASVDRRGSLRWGDFARIHIPRPSIEEQRAIVKVIETADRELELLRSQLDALREQKKGLMQQLLTGKLRVVGI